MTLVVNMNRSMGSAAVQSIELLKSRPAHLAVFLHHVVSQFDPATLLCYLYSDLYKQTNSKETRRVFLEFHQFFLDRSAHLKVSVPEEISVDLEKDDQSLFLRIYIATISRLCKKESTQKFRGTWKIFGRSAAWG